MRSIPLRSLTALAAGLPLLGSAAHAQDDPAPEPAPAPADDPQPEATSAEGDAPEAAAEPVLALKAGKVIVRPGKTIADAVVLVRGGVIEAVGKGIAIPEGAEVLEGAVVCAGFFDPMSVAGIASDSSTTSTGDPSVVAVDAIDPYGQAPVLDELVHAGVLVTRSVVGARASIGGVSAVLRTAGPEPLLEHSALSSSVGIGRGFAFSAGVDPLDRISQIDRLISQLENGEKYGKSVAEYEKKLAEWKEEIAEKEEELEKDFKKAKKSRDKKVKDAEEDGKEFKEKKYKESRRPKPPKLDPERAVLARVVNGELPLVVSADRALEIRELLAQTEKFPRLRMILAGGRSALACAAGLVERGVPVIVTPSPAEAGGPIGELDPGLALAGELDALGIEVLIGSGATGGYASRDLPLLAALAVGHGLDRDAALRAITSGPARAFDVSGDVGTVRRGRAAELIVLSGDPLASSSRVTAAISGGKVVHRAD